MIRPGDTHALVSVFVFSDDTCQYQAIASGSKAGMESMGSCVQAIAYDGDRRVVRSYLSIITVGELEELGEQSKAFAEERRRRMREISDEVINDLNREGAGAQAIAAVEAHDDAHGAPEEHIDPITFDELQSKRSGGGDDKH